MRCCDEIPHDSVRWLVTAARRLGLAYPVCLRLIAPSASVAVVQHGTRPSTNANPALLRPEEERSRYWRASPTTTVYRALARHVRRHLAPRRQSVGPRFVDSGDPLVVGEQVRACDRVRRAFADMVWARTIEAEVERRRWSDRPPLYSEGSSLYRTCGGGSQMRAGQHLAALA